MAWKIEPVFIAQPSGPAICFSEYRLYEPHEVPHEEAWENARLMEAAPELLAACERILELGKDANCGLSEVSAAIRKARSQ